ncbi:MAG: DUF3127 domain-containing protein [Chitinophagales bacterium]
MSLTIDGNLFEVFDVEQVTASFKKREFVLETDTSSNYPQYPKFQLVQDNCSILDAYSKGDLITVHFDLRGRPYKKPDGTTLYFTNLQVWRIEKASAGDVIPNTPSQEMKSMPPSHQEDIIENDDLPF